MITRWKKEEFMSLDDFRYVCIGLLKQNKKQDTDWGFVVLLIFFGFIFSVFIIFCLVKIVYDVETSKVNIIVYDFETFKVNIIVYNVEIFKVTIIFTKIW